jgi:hypothetical protein
LVLVRAPVLLTEDNSLNALALDGVMRTRDPFSLTNENYFGSDKRTRLTLLLVDLDLYPNQGETISIVTAQAQDARCLELMRWLWKICARFPTFPGCLS